MNRQIVLNKIKSRVGFSLSELLVCTLIMMLSTSVLVSTMRLAADHYNNIITDSEATMLCRTLSLALRDKLSFVVKMEEAADGGFLYYSTSQNQEYAPFKIVLINADDAGELTATEGNFGRVALKYYSGSGAGTGTIYNLVNKNSYADYGKGLVTSCVVEPIFPSDGGELVKYFTVKIGVYKAKDTTNAIMENDFVVYPFLQDVPKLSNS